MKDFKGRNGFITGAASSKGIGRSLALELAREGMNLLKELRKSLNPH
ncbi:MAG: hypothetical protein ACW99L_19800 [Promethearchaeota archaeon]